MAEPDAPTRFTIVGENIHTTRIVLRKGNRVKVLDDGTEGVRFHDTSGQTRYLTVPSEFRQSATYQQGQIKHVMLAVQKGLSIDSADQEEGAEYVRAEVRRQVEAGADYLDLNVDEVSAELDVQKAAMRWLVDTVQEISPIPLSIDSSNTDILRTGLRADRRKAGRPLLNSATLERLETLDLVREFDCQAIVTASGYTGMPADEHERVANVRELLRHARDIPLADIHVDPLVFPISVDSRSGRHYLDAVRILRETYGSKIHITGGLSNVSFGIPNRRLVNETFFALALDAGIDGAIVDPVQNKLKDIRSLDRTSEPFQITSAMLNGEDDFCIGYLQAWREGRLG
jgi:5-methyltetrahydrofolate--homocysteine methyltransferase